jgi:hypothetical protein
MNHVCKHESYYRKASTKDLEKSGCFLALAVIPGDAEPRRDEPAAEQGKKGQN